MFPPRDDGPAPGARPRHEHPAPDRDRRAEFLREHPCDIPDLTVEGLTLLVTRDHSSTCCSKAARVSLACEGFGRDRSSAKLVAPRAGATPPSPPPSRSTVSRELAAADAVARERSARAAARDGRDRRAARGNGERNGAARGAGHRPVPARRAISRGRGVAGPDPGRRGRALAPARAGRAAPARSAAGDAEAPRARGFELSNEAIRSAPRGAARSGASDGREPSRAAARRAAVQGGAASPRPAARGAARDAQRALSRVEAGRFSKLRAELKGTLRAARPRRSQRQRARTPGAAAARGLARRRHDPPRARRTARATSMRASTSRAIASR